MENPLIALLASPGADSRVLSRGFTSIAQLLSPFSSVNIDIRDPSNGQYVSNKISLDIRDIKRQGHLLSLSVLPYVLHEALENRTNLDDVLKSYFKCLRYWAEPSDQETLRTYLACIFVVSGCEENPMGELSKLIQNQHTEQHSNSEAKSLSPSHCSRPKWTIPNTLKHYVLLHDCARDDESRTNDIYNQMCATYGVQSCQLLKIGSGSSDGLPDAWQIYDEMNSILERGLALALENARNANISDKRDTPPTVVSTISPSYAMVQSPSISSQSSPTSESSFQTNISTRLSSLSDRESCTKLIQSFTKECLVPHVERQMRTLLDQLTDRKTIGKSLTIGMKKWFGGSAAQNNASQNQVYGPESPEMKCRRLADLAFQFGLYSLAHSHYRSLKKDFEGEQAWLYQAVAMEMAAVALHLSNPGITGKQFPNHYLDNSLTALLNNSGKYTAVMRCAVNTASIYSDLGMYKEAALLFARITTLDNDQCVGVGQAMAASYFRRGIQLRKSSFYYVLAGNRFCNGTVQNIGMECYKKALPEYFEKNWEGVEDHLCSLLARGVRGPELLQSCASRLLRGSDWQSEKRQREFLNLYVDTIAQTGLDELSSSPLPVLYSNDIQVICGERPLSEELPSRTDLDWITLERAAFYNVAGNTTAFRFNQLVSDNSTENTKILDTPPGERYRVIVQLKNPLVIELTIHNVRLSAKVLKFKNNATEEHIFSQHTLPSLVFQPEEVKKVELWITPHENTVTFSIDSILFDIHNEQEVVIPGVITLSSKGKRLNKSAKQMKEVVYTADERLKANVTSEQWPLLNFKVALSQQDVVYTSQNVKLTIDIENICDQTITHMTLVTDGVDCVDLQLEDSLGQRLNTSSKIEPTNPPVRVFTLETTLEQNDRVKTVLNLRANESNRPVAVLVLYKGSLGTLRHWRTVIPFTSTPILDIKSHVLDVSRGLVSLHCSNRIANSDAAMAKIDIIRVKSIYQNLSKKGVWQDVPSLLELVPVSRHPVQLDGEQSQNICFFMSKSLNDNANMEFWLADKIHVPQWPAPQITPKDDEVIFEKRHLAIFWKASVVANDGHVSILCGELFIPCPFMEINAPIPGSVWSENSKELNSNGKAPLLALCEQITPVEHSFETSRLCYLSFVVEVINQDTDQRDIDVSLRFRQKVSEAVFSLDQVAPDSRLLWWPDKAVSHARIVGGGQYKFKLQIRVSQPSIYELGGKQMVIEGCYPNTNERFFVDVPSTLAIVHSLS
ncbi:unnamed protein product [Auanema sp. JU1783]|nr:unnamed protein product [Auanema sp. JU1783]